MIKSYEIVPMVLFSLFLIFLVVCLMYCLFYDAALRKCEPQSAYVVSVSNKFEQRKVCLSIEVLYKDKICTYTKYYHLTNAEFYGGISVGDKIEFDENNEPIFLKEGE